MSKQVKQISDYAVVSTTWRETNKVNTAYGRADYFTRRQVKGYRVYYKGRAVEKFYRLRDAVEWIAEQDKEEAR